MARDRELADELAHLNSMGPGAHPPIRELYWMLNLAFDLSRPGEVIYLLTGDGGILRSITSSGIDGAETRQVGLEPTTGRLTADCSTIELLPKKLTIPRPLNRATLDNLYG